jgi:hypothetical protein
LARKSRCFVRACLFALAEHARERRGVRLARERVEEEGERAAVVLRREVWGGWVLLVQRSVRALMLSLNPKP